jgi:hypothetical protein
VTKTITLSILIATAMLAARFGPDTVAARAPTARHDDGGSEVAAAKRKRPPSDAPAPAKRRRDTGAVVPASEPIEGFGARARGGEGGRVIVIDDPTEDNVRKIFNEVARTPNVILRFEVDRPIEITRPLPHLTSPHLTIEGNGATLDGDGLQKEVALIDIRTNDVIVRNLRLRNGYDNLRLNGPEAYDIAVSHVSSTGSQDDGISVGYGAHDVTVQYVFLAGNTRSFFCKYENGGDISLHHSWIQKGWIRSPLLSGQVLADVRNVIVEDWAEWGSRFENGATGNVINSLFTLSPYARSIGGKPHAAVRLVDAGPVYLEGNVVRGEVDPVPSGTARAPIKTPPVKTASVLEMEKTVRSRAGCMPRDEVDQAYIELQSGWHVSESEAFRHPAERPEGALRTAPRKPGREHAPVPRESPHD